MATKAKRTKQSEYQTALAKLLAQDCNRICADCLNKGPRWASWNLGVFLCIRCAGIHRNLGVHISRVKSVNLDSWTPEQISSIQSWGNALANAVYECNLPSDYRRPKDDISVEAFIRNKYEKKIWKGTAAEAAQKINKEKVHIQSPSPTHAAPVESDTSSVVAQPVHVPPSSNQQIPVAHPVVAPPPSLSNTTANTFTLFPAHATTARVSTAPIASQPPRAPGSSLLDLDVAPAKDSVSPFESRPGQQAVDPNTEDFFKNMPQAAEKPSEKDSIMSLFGPSQPSQAAMMGGFQMPMQPGFAGMGMTGGMGVPAGMAMPNGIAPEMGQAMGGGGMMPGMQVQVGMNGQMPTNMGMMQPNMGMGGMTGNPGAYQALMFQQQQQMQQQQMMMMQGQQQMAMGGQPAGTFQGGFAQQQRTPFSGF